MRAETCRNCGAKVIRRRKEGATWQTHTFEQVGEGFVFWMLWGLALGCSLRGLL